MLVTNNLYEDEEDDEDDETSDQADTE